MAHFTEEQMQEIAVRLGVPLPPAEPSAQVRDGFIRKGDMVWWRASLGPELVKSDTCNHWQNILDYPNVYQIDRPNVDVKYKD